MTATEKPSPNHENGGKNNLKKSNGHKYANGNGLKKGPKKIMGLELAPLDVPWKRRMETLAVALWIATFFAGGLACTFLNFYVIFYTKFYWLGILYMTYYFYDLKTCERGGRRVDWVRNWGKWRSFISYFPIDLVKTVDLDPSQNYLFGAHPHGVLCCGAFACFATAAPGFDKKFPGLTPHLLTVEINYKFPLYREYALSFGACSASRASMNYLLSRPEGGHVSVLVPGGASESLDALPGDECKLHLKNRKGFIKVAIQNGSPLVPVFCFGENDVFRQVSNGEGSRLRKIQTFLQGILSFAPVLVLGRGIFQYTFGLLPQRRPIHVVVGAPIPLDKNPTPSQEEIDDLHSKYVQSLIQLFETHKATYGKEKSYLKIV